MLQHATEPPVDYFEISSLLNSDTFPNLRDLVMVRDIYS